MKTASSKQSGFTLIEVMVAIGILTAGSLGLMSLIQATIRGNSEAHMMAIATERTHSWLERVKRDSLMWRAAGQDPVARQGTVYLQDVTGVWYAPLPALGGSPAADFSGQDLGVGIARPQVYCTHIAGRWVEPGETIQIDVRTVFLRREGNLYELSQNCAGNAGAITADLASQTPSFRQITTSTIVRRHP